MIVHRPRPTWFRIARATSALLVLAWLWAAVLPVVDGLFHTDDRCCANGICCCRPKPSPTGWGVRAACACGAHDEHDAGLPTLRPFLTAASFSLPRPAGSRGTPAVRDAGPAVGHERPLDHPPDHSTVSAS